MSQALISKSKEGLCADNASDLSHHPSICTAKTSGAMWESRRFLWVWWFGVVSLRDVLRATELPTHITKPG
eukprot:702476-Amphidinium_carterae.1